jgi:hypothetical protein
MLNEIITGKSGFCVSTVSTVCTRLWAPEVAPSGLITRSCRRLQAGRGHPAGSGTSRRDYRRRAGSRCWPQSSARVVHASPHLGGIGCPPGTRGLWLSLTGALLSENERAIYRTGQLRFARASTVAESQESVLAGASTLACPNGEAGGIGQATCRRRRLARANRPPQAATNPGRPAPTMGPGTAVAEIDPSKTFPAVAEKV